MAKAKRANKTVTVRLLTSIASPCWAYGAGETVQLPAEQAQAWVARGIAEPAEEGEA